MDNHIQRMLTDGWEVMNSVNDTGHVRVGKTLAVAGLTGGLSLLFGASRTASTLTLTFKKDLPEFQHRCGRCGVAIPFGGKYCKACGYPAPTNLTIPSGGAERILPQSPTPRLRAQGSVGRIAARFGGFLKAHPVATVIVLLVIGLGIAPVLYSVLGSSGEGPVTRRVAPPRVTPILDLPSLALCPRPEVETAIGKPTKYIRRSGETELADEADYPWGIAGYNRSRLNFLILRFPSTLKDYREAFDLLGLPNPRPPFVARGGDGTTQPFWQEHPFGNSYTCCADLTFQSIWISRDWKEMHVLILDLDAPEEWSVQQCTMYVRRTRLALPKGARFKGNPLDAPVSGKR